MTSPTDFPADITTAFNGNIKRPRVGFFYTVGLFAVTVVMAILPLIYIGFIALVIYATYYHAVHNMGMLTNRVGSLSARVTIFKLVLYATPIFMGTVTALFMIKPLFARRIHNHQPYALNPETEPRLYSFIAKICEIVGAPMPTLIELDCEVNAAAGLRRGFGSFFSRDLTLCIGLPLVAGLTMREFAGVIAHEFGHFTQPIAVRLNYILGRIQGWFARVIFERDSWDAWLDEMAETEDGWVAIIVGFARLGVWFSRKILFALLLFGRAISCFLLRQQEYHADQFEIRLAGSDAFERTVDRIVELGALTSASFQEIRVSWNLNKRLPDNIPQFVINKGQMEVGHRVKQALKGDLGFVRTGLFHTHPSDADRVRAARLANAPGIFHLEAPASQLFENFAVPARIVTQLYFQEIELPLQMAKIYEVPALTSATIEASPEESPRASVDRFLFGVVTPLRPIFPKIKPVADRAAALATIEAMPSQINQIADAIGNACTQFDQADEKMIEAASEGNDVSPWRAEKDQARRSLRAVLDACEERLSLALSLAGAPPSKCEQLRNLAPALLELDNLRIASALFVLNMQDRGRLARLNEAIANIEAVFRDIPCPWPEGEGANLLEYFKAVQEGEMLISDWADQLVRCSIGAYMKMLNELTTSAEKFLENPQTNRPIRVAASPISPAASPA